MAQAVLVFGGSLGAHSINMAADDGWELVSTVSRGEVPLAIMRRERPSHDRR